MVEVEDVSPFLVSDIINVLWPLLYDTGTRWECCLLDELETAVEGCVQVVHNSSELSTAGQSTNEPRDGSGPLPREAAVWWLALNQTCPYYDGGASQWLFIEARAATTANGSFFALLRTLTLDTSHFGFAQPQLGPCGGDRQYCCMEEPSPQTYPSPASCTGEGLACMQHGPDILCEAPRCAAPATVEGRPGVYSCPGGGVMLVGTLVGAGG